MSPQPRGKLLFILNPPLGHVTVYLRGLIFEEFLSKLGWQAKYVSLAKSPITPDLDHLFETEEKILKLAKDYDIIYLLKVNSLSFVRLLRARTSAKIVFELTDALWMHSFRMQGWLFLEEILEISDAVFSENEFACSFGRRHNDHVFSLRACTQTEKFNALRAKMPLRDDHRVVIGWIGSTQTIGAILSIAQPLRRICRRHPHVELRLLGCDPHSVKKALQGIRYSILPSYNEDQMVEEALRMDIGIYPPPASLEDYRIRGALKALIYMSAGVPPVCLNAGDCSRIVVDGYNGFLVSPSDRNDWETKLDTLISNTQLREQLGRAAHQTVVERHSLQSSVSDLDKALIDVVHLPRQTTLRSQNLTTAVRIARRIPTLSLIFVRNLLVGAKSFFLAHR